MNRYFVRLLILLIIMYLISITVFTLVLYRHNKNRLIQDLQTYLERGANLVTYLMPEGYFDRALDADSIPEDEYRQYITRFTQVSQSYDYKFLYAVRNVDGNFHFIACTITPQELAHGQFEPYWLKYELAPEALKLAYSTRKKQFGTYSDEWGSFYTCFLPQETEEGNFYITGADIELENYHAMLKRNSLNSFFQLIALSLLLLPIFVINYKLRNVSIKSLKFNAEMLSTAPLKCVVTDEKGHITFANDAFLRDLGLEKIPPGGLSIYQQNLRMNPLFERIAYCIEKQTKWEGDFPMTGDNGTETWEYAVINSGRIQSSSQPVYYAFSQDVTTMRKRTEQINHSNIILNCMTNAIHMLLSNPDPNKVLQNVVSDMGKCLCLDSLRIIKRIDLHFKIPFAWYRENINPISKAKQIAKDTKPSIVDWENILKSGMPIHGHAAQFPPEFLRIADLHNDYKVSVYPIRDDTELWGFILAQKPEEENEVSSQFADNALITLSDSIAMAVRRYQMEDELRRSTEAKSSFLSSVSHEIRTPLNGILGMISLMNTTSLTAEQKEYLNAIANSGKQLQSLISDVLDISRIEAGKFTLHRTPVNLRSVVYVVQNIVQFQVNEKGLTLTIQISDRLPDILITDELRIKQILLNLINNAVKFTHQGGITVSADMPEPGMVEFQISDTGIGMTDEQLSKVFQPFYQIETSGAQVQGSGLGLVITRRLVQLMQGDISLTSCPGKGTTFVVRIPVTDIDSRIR